MAQPAAQDSEQLIDVRRAAALIGRHPETIRRWIWAGRLIAVRRGRRLFVASSDVQRLAGPADLRLDLWSWRELRRRTALSGVPGSSRSAADLVIEDRRVRAGGWPDGGR